MGVLGLVVLKTKQPATGLDRGGLLQCDDTYGSRALSAYYDTEGKEIAQTKRVNRPNLLTGAGRLRRLPRRNIAEV